MLAQSEAYYLAKGAVHHAIAEIEREADIRGVFDLDIPKANSSVSYRVSPWGCFLRIDAAANVSTESQELTAYVGALPDERFERAVTTLNGSYPLVLAGRAGVFGSSLLGPQTATTGEIRGQPFRGVLPDQESMSTFSGNLAPFECSVVCEFLENLDSERESCDNLTDLSVVVSSDRLVATECVKTFGQVDINIDGDSALISDIQIFADRSIAVRGNSTLYQVLLKSNTSVTISGSAKLIDCILVAPEISVTQTATVSSQLIATERISVTGSSRLGSRSVLLLKHEELDQEDMVSVEITSIAPCSATVIYDITDPSFNRQEAAGVQLGRVLLGETSTLFGRIISDGYTELRGSLIGTCTSELFYYDEQPTSYINWIVDGRIYYSADIARITMPIFTSSDTHLEIHHATLGGQAWTD
jgi:hypothetical protein